MSPQWIMSFEKLMSEDEVKALRKTLEAASIIAKSKAHQGPVRDECCLLLALGTGLRVSEIAALKIEDIDLKRGGNSLIVRHGKGDKLRVVKFSSSLKTLIQDYLDYRTSDSEYLFPSQRQDHMFPTAIQKVFKKWARRSGLPPRFSIHSARHFYASELLRVSKNLRLVQQQLGHSSPQTTTVYAQVLDEEITEAVEKL
ncbi:MAG: phage integrase family protein [Candidatus Marinimicrobia bacterium]|jgi:integrase/recombinase XerD|nr:phage integrase family protein [Candidatus Neomarinimicrobiota bacterium]MBT7089906.1 phage integrase family protein [Candidatus Neomarinimicrobiota bacterium]MBT7685145.1 phage integrase family protein [Candidatus Neomarinimicrobiota bacterium]